MLEMRPGCEQCDRDLPPDGPARICSFECTFCEPCATDVFNGQCPNCGGDLLARPPRPTALLEKFPSSAARVFKPKGEKK